MGAANPRKIQKTLAVVAGVLFGMIFLFAWGPVGERVDGTRISTGQDNLPYSYVINNPDPQMEGTALIALVDTDRGGRTKIHWSNEGYWHETQAVVTWNGRFNHLSPRQVEASSFSRERDTTCEDRPDATVSDCPLTAVTRDGGFVTRGTIAKGVDIWYTAAFGADRAELGIEAQTEHPLQVEWAREAETRLHLIGPPGSVNGQVNISLEAPNYGVIVLIGGFDKEPVIRVEGDNVTYEFQRKGHLWDAGTGRLLGVAGFPLPEGSYTVTATGGRGPVPLRGEIPAVALARIIDPGFVQSDGTFIPIEPPR